MSDVKFTCPHCNQRLEVPEEILGQTAECPTCQGQMTLPDPRWDIETTGLKKVKDPRSSAEPGQLFLHIPVGRLIFLSIVSFGLYEAYWIYKNWQCIAERDKLKILPFWRGIFGIFHCHTLLSRIHADEEARSIQVPSFSANGLAFGWVVLTLCSYAVNQLFGIPGAIIATFIPAFLCLVPVQNHVNAVTEKRNPGQPFYRWSTGHIVCVVYGVLVWALLLILLGFELGGGFRE